MACYINNESKFGTLIHAVMMRNRKHIVWPKFYKKHINTYWCVDRRYAEKDIIQEIWEYVSTNKILCRHEYPKLNTNYDEFSFQQSNIHILGFAHFFRCWYILCYHVI